MSEYGSPSKIMQLLVNGETVPMQGPESFRRVAEWERQIETLDQKEMELHQTQMRLVREQTATFIRDLSSVRQEIAALYMKQDALGNELATLLDDKHQQLRTAIDKASQDRHESLHARLLAFESELPNQKRELIDLQTYLKDKLEVEIEGKLAAHMKSTEDLFAQHQDAINKVHKSMGQLDFHHGTLNERLDNVAQDLTIVASQVETLDIQLKGLRATLDVESSATAKQLQDLQERHASTIERLGCLEKAVGNSADVHQRQLEEAHMKIDELHGTVSSHQCQLVHHATLHERIDYLEKMLGDSADQHEAMRLAHEEHLEVFRRHARDLEAMQPLQGHHASMAQQLDHLEQLLSDSAVKHSEQLASLTAAHERIHGRVSACEVQAASLGKSHGLLANEKSGLAANHDAMKVRIEALEGLLAESADTHIKELAAVSDAQEKHATLLSKQARDVETLKVGHAHHATITERVGYLEQLVGDSADKHTEESALAHAKFERVHSRLAACEKFGSSIDELRTLHINLSKDNNNLLDHHASLKERFDHIENLLGDSVDKHAEELAAVRSNYDKHAAAFVKHCREFDGLRAAHAQHAGIRERLDYLEKVVEDSAEKHNDGLANALGKLDTVHARLSLCERHGGAISDLHKALATLAADRAAADARHTSMAERMSYLEELVGDSPDRHAQELKALKDAHSKHARDLESFKLVAVHHTTLDERMKYLDAAIGASAEKHALELEAAHVKLEHLHGRLSACEVHGATVSELKQAHSGLANEKSVLKSQHASLKERVDFLEGALADSAGNHAQMLEAAHAKLEHVHGRLAACERNGAVLESLRKAHGELASGKAALDIHHATLEERLLHVEQRLGDSSERQAQEVALLNSKHDELHGRLTEERAARERHHGFLRELLGKHKDHGDAHQAAITERVEYLENLVGDNADKHARELADHRNLATKLASELKAREAHHGTMEQRLTKLESIHGDSATKLTQELRAAHLKIDNMYGRLVAVKDAWRADSPPLLSDR